MITCPLGRGSASCDTIRVARHRIDLDYCKGCGICVPECPCGSVVMEPEP